MKVACIMCTWEEQLMAPLAIESSKDFVDRYIVMDNASKDDTVGVIKECGDKWKLDIDIYIRPDLSHRQRRMFAIKKVDEEWVLIQEADEVFHTDGPNSILNLKKLFRLRNVAFLAPMTVLFDDFLHTHPPYKQPPHLFLYHNNHTFSPPPPAAGGWRDFPEMIGVKIQLSKVYKFNCFVKSPKRMFLRQYWAEWLFTNAFKKYPNIEEYVKAKLGLDNLNDQVKEWHEKTKSTLEPYDQKKHGYYPKVIREYISRGKIRGYEKNVPP